MKKYTLLLGLMISFLGSSQEEVINNTWYLIDMNNECYGYDIGENDEFDIYNVQLSFTQNGDVVSFHSEMCASFDGVAEITDDTIAFSNLEMSEDVCVAEMIYQYEQGYACALDNNFSYTVTEEPSGALTLFMYNDIFMETTFSTEPLQIEETALQDYYIAPNPIDDFLNITTQITTPFSIQIWDINGNLVHSEHSKTPNVKIDFSSKEKGIYILQIESENQKYRSKKIIKK